MFALLCQGCPGRLNLFFKGVRDVIEIASKEDRKSSKSKKESNRKLSAPERERMIELLTKEMKSAAAKLEFEQAAFLRDRIRRLREGKNDI